MTDGMVFMVHNFNASISETILIQQTNLLHVEAPLIRISSGETGLSAKVRSF